MELREKIQLLGQTTSGVALEVAVCASGEVKICSGLNVIASSGVYVVANTQTICASRIRTGQTVPVTGASGGQSICISGYWCSGTVHELILKSMSGMMYVGDSGCRPFAAAPGYGYALIRDEQLKIDICKPCLVYACAATSGSYLTYMGTDY